MIRRDIPLALCTVITTSPLWRHFTCKTIVTGCLLAAVSNVAAAHARLGVLTESALTMVTHTTCTVVPTHKSGKSRYVLIEGPLCPVGGGSCEHIALMHIDGKTRTLMRTVEPAVSSSGAFSSEFAQGDLRVRVDYAAPPLHGRGKRTAKLQLKTATGQSSVTGVARCGAE